MEPFFYKNLYRQKLSTYICNVLKIRIPNKNEWEVLV